VFEHVERLEATVLQVQRLSTEDGPGLRTTVFFKGCPLACRWCQNPESIAPAPQIVWHERLCLGCGACVPACPSGARTWDGGRPRVATARCAACGACAEVCPTAAAERLGERRGVDDLVAELLRDRAFYGPDGGVTLSGGEPTSWPRFTAALLDRCRAAGLHTALDTSGQCAAETLRALVERTDLVLYDLKHHDAARHEALTGRPNDRILANARLVGELVRASRAGERPKRLWVRTPLVPGATADAAPLRGLGAFLAAELGDVVERWELCAFNPLCADKYRQLGRTWEWDGAPLLAADEVAGLLAAARAAVPWPERVVATGATHAAGREGP
jgi:pyruvate formate lyase activating enzyme